jgi:YebC/PmpR family DNA-binding regulatory protein
MPKDNIDRAIKKGTGELPGVSYEESMFEGYGPGGVAVLVDSLTDNRKRTVADIRHIFSKNAGNLGEAGCVSWMFDKKGLIVYEKAKIDEEKLLNLALEAGAQDVRETDKEYEVITEPGAFERIKKQLEEAQLIPAYAEIGMVPQSTVRLAGKEAQQMLRLMESLEDSDDVQHVYANFDIPDEEMEPFSS